MAGTDPRGRSMDQQAYQQDRYEQQQGPLANQFAYMTGRANEADYGNYTDIMNLYRGVATGTAGGAGAGGGGGGYSATYWDPEQISYKDPFNSYAGFTDFSTTGGYSPEDIANMRARGTSPIRAAYANAEREVARQRSLQGGYSPNAFALQGRMAREQGQLGADAVQNVEAGLAEARNKGRLSGLAGMSDIEKQRLAADLDVSKYNANAKMQAAQSNAGASNAAAASGAAATAASRADQMRALSGMTSLYGTTPGMSQMFGNQAISTVGQGGTFGNNQVQNTIEMQKLPGQFEQTNNRINQGIQTGRNVADIIGTVNYGINAYKNRPQAQQNQPIGPTYDPGGGTSAGRGGVMPEKYGYG